MYHKDWSWNLLQSISPGINCTSICLLYVSSWMNSSGLAHPRKIVIDDFSGIRQRCSMTLVWWIVNDGLGPVNYGNIKMWPPIVTCCNSKDNEILKKRKGTKVTTITMKRGKKCRWKPPDPIGLSLGLRVTCQTWMSWIRMLHVKRWTTNNEENCRT